MIDSSLEESVEQSFVSMKSRSLEPQLILRIIVALKLVVTSDY